MTKRADKAKIQDVKYREMPDIVVKVVCRYRAELFFKISRKTKLSRLFNAWTDRMERTGGKKLEGKGITAAGIGTGESQALNGTVSKEATPPPPASGGMQFVFTHSGRSVEADQTPEDAGMEDGDEILAVELMDLTDGPGTEEWVSAYIWVLKRLHILRPPGPAPRTTASENRQELDGKPSRASLTSVYFKSTSNICCRAKRSLEEIFDGVYVYAHFPFFLN